MLGEGTHAERLTRAIVRPPEVPPGAVGRYWRVLIEGQHGQCSLFFRKITTVRVWSMELEGAERKRKPY